MKDLQYNFKLAKEALDGKRDDVYPCREDIPAELWGMPIQRKIDEKDLVKHTISKVNKL